MCYLRGKRGSSAEQFMTWSGKSRLL
uniref:Uncharacterized protein n=1 Tax=Anguilla anguilla TaxID=7936 RepID=A0A0E9PCY0_ANGAN